MTKRKDEKEAPHDPLAEATQVKDQEMQKPNEDIPGPNPKLAADRDERSPDYATVNDNAPDGGPVVSDS